MIRHVLLDADGVVQRVPGDGWRALVSRHVDERTEEFVAAVAALEKPMLTGEGDLPSALGPVLQQYGLDLDPEDFYSGVWLAIETLPESLALVRTLRAADLGVHLVTNQHPRRAAYMKQVLGYEDLFDSCFYSCDLGAAKPHPEFFARVVDRLAADPGELLFIDDSAANVDGARHSGVHAVTWHHDEGVETLRGRLAEHALRISEW